MSNHSVGSSPTRIDARGKVTGETQYPGDLHKQNMLHMKILMAERPHARVLNIHIEKALASPGVAAVYTAKDIPVNEYGLQIPDQPVLCGPGASKPYTDIVRFVGDQIAVVVAETEAQAAAAIKLIEVDYEDLPPLLDPVLAMQPEAAILHPDRGESNVCVHYKIRKGDVDAGFAQADVIVEGEYQTPVQEHAYLQPEAGLAYLDEEGRIVVESAGQWTHADRETVAHSLGIPNEQVRIIYPAIGGAFGGREDLSVQVVLALAAMNLKRPVKIVWSRRESIIGHGKRHAVLLRAKWGATKDGKLVAVQNELIGDGGAYMYTTNKVLGNATITSSGPYNVPNVKTDVYGVYTNNVPGAAFRGFGAPQALFMAESQMNKLAEKLGMDPVEFRLKNALKTGDTMSVGTPTPNPVSITECIEAARDSFKWKKMNWKKKPVAKKSAIVRGRGFAAGFKNVGFSFGYKENCWAKVEIHGNGKIERVVLHHAGAEVGQGFQTVMSQMAAEVVGVPLEMVEMHTSDTATQGNPGSASASRLTFMAGNSVKGAAEAALAKWNSEERPAIAEFSYFAPPTTPMNHDTGYSMPNFQYAYVAQAAEVEVDTETGHVHVKRIVSADDVGKAINPDLVAAQIEGAVVQAHGYAVLEEYKTKDGRVLTDQFSTYLLPTILDIPEKVESVIVEVPDPNGPWGARGMGELPYLPVAPAIAAAIYDATGVWIDEFPFTPERVLKALGKIK
ncbi:MAG: xanthine dehydrogenase family protein [Anaerolineales bacterium]|nr:xanthine dehydrogenase family protein [Anaerolineales bacterium]MCB9143766.1 xanthine dehydrogenase family protein [Anaerolineales bacterium]